MRLRKQSYILLFLSALLVDRITKFWAFISVQHKPFAINRFLDFSFAWNRGISWGILHKSSRLSFILLSAFIAAIIVFFLIYTVREYRKRSNVVFEVLVLSGAVSNFVDRLYYGAVIDFIDMHCMGWHWPTFNVADMCIVIGVGGILLKGLLWKGLKK